MTYIKLQSNAIFKQKYTQKLIGTFRLAYLLLFHVRGKRRRYPPKMPYSIDH